MKINALFAGKGVAFCILSDTLANRGIRPHSLRKVNRNGIKQKTRH